MMKIGQVFKHKRTDWIVKVCYFTNVEVGTEDLERDDAPNTRYLSVFHIYNFLEKFEEINNTTTGK